MNRRVGWVLAIAVIWVMLWDQLTVANVLAGLIVGVVVLIAFPLPAVVRGVDPHLIGGIRLWSSVGWDLVVSNLHVAWMIINPRATFTSIVVECEISTDSPPLLSTIANIIALSPGMMAVEAARDPNVMLVHTLTFTPEEVRRRVGLLERRVIAAFGTTDDRQAVRR